MGELIYSAIASLDGYVADVEGKFDWGEPDEEVHSFINELQRDVGTYLYGRRLYEVMSAWEDLTTDDQPPHVRDFANIWRGADKVVYSKTLDDVTTTRTRIERSFESEAVRKLKASAEHDVTVGGPELAAQAFMAGLVDECRVFLAPVVLGGGKQFLPDNFGIQLELMDECRFESGIVYLRYSCRK